MEELKRCKYCGNEYIPQKKGLHNWRNLLKFDSQDFIFLVIFLLIIFSAYAYQRDTKICREFVANQSEVIKQLETNIQNYYMNESSYEELKLNISKYTENKGTLLYFFVNILFSNLNMIVSPFYIK